MEVVSDIERFKDRLGNALSYNRSCYGASGHRVEATEDLVPTLEQAFQSREDQPVDLPVDYSENKKVLIDELAEKVSMI